MLRRGRPQARRRPVYVEDGVLSVQGDDRVWIALAPRLRISNRQFLNFPGVEAAGRGRRRVVTVSDPLGR
jgi:hypothetical protein